MNYVEFTKPKKGKNAVRKIVSADKELSKYLKLQMHSLNELLKKELRDEKLDTKDIMHGFIKGRNAVTAASKHIGYNYTIMLDIEDFFDNVTRDKLPTHSCIQDEMFHRDGYTPQGFCTSPTLANISIVKAMKTLTLLLDAITHRNYALTIYADDIAISYNTKSMAPMIEQAVTTAIQSSGFTINTKKTRVKSGVDNKWRRILGINVGENSIRATRKTMRKLRAAKHQSKFGDEHAIASYGGLTQWKNCNRPKHEFFN